MAAPKGNKFWQLRSKHGRDKLFKTPDLMWQAACEYFEWCDNNPLMETVVHGKDSTIIQLPKMRPYTIHGLCSYLDCNTQYFKTFKAQLTEKDKDFNTVITRIEEIIYRQKFEGASCGFLNPNIIARDLGLTDKQQIEHSGQIVWNEEKTYEK